jgi:hypothetical protein
MAKKLIKKTGEPDPIAALEELQAFVESHYELAAKDGGFKKYILNEALEEIQSAIIGENNKIKDRLGLRDKTIA